MRESKETVIDGIGVKVTQLPAKRARNLLRRILSAGGPAIGKALSGAQVDLGSLGEWSTKSGSSCTRSASSTRPTIA